PAQPEALGPVVDHVAKRSSQRVEVELAVAHRLREQLRELLHPRCDDVGGTQLQASRLGHWTGIVLAAQSGAHAGPNSDTLYACSLRFPPSRRARGSSADAGSRCSAST